jgi:DnaJ-class molecular chaperone
MADMIKKVFEMLQVVCSCDECCGTGKIELSTGGGNTKEYTCKECEGRGRVKKEFFDAEIVDFGHYEKQKGKGDKFISDMPKQ